jgi:anti-sigma factor RsiW
METPRCDAIVLSALAWMDGESAPIDRAEIDAHVRTCGRCASEIAALRLLAERLAPVSRAAVTADVWPAIEARLDRPRAIPAGLVLAAAAVFLLAWRALEAAAMDPLTWWTRPVTVGVAAVLFLCLRVNPFRVEPRLVKDGYAES